MRINTLKIKNFRNIKELELSFKDVNILIGKNGVGKTTVLNAISWLFTGKSFTNKSIQVKPIENGIIKQQVSTLVEATIETTNKNNQKVELQITRKFDEKNTTTIVVKNLLTNAVEVPKVREFERFARNELGFDIFLFNPLVLFNEKWDNIRDWFIEKFNLIPNNNIPFLPLFQEFELSDQFDLGKIKKVIKQLEDEVQTMEFALQQMEHLSSLVEDVPEDIILAIEQFKEKTNKKNEILEKAKKVQKIVEANIKIRDAANEKALEVANDLLHKIDERLYVEEKVKFLNLNNEKIEFSELSTGEKLRLAIALNNVFYEKGYEVPIVLDELGTLTGGFEVKNQVFGTEAVNNSELMLEAHTVSPTSV